MTSLDSCAQHMARGLSEGWSDSDMVRLMAQAVDDFRWADEVGRREEFLAEPRPTGDIRWDAALAGLAVHLCRQAGMERTPAWTRDERRFSPNFFWIGLTPDSTLKAYVFQRTPAYFKGRGVMLYEANLVSV